MIAVLTQPTGLVTVTDGVDVDHQIPSFPSLQKEVSALVDDLSGAVAGVREIATTVTALAGAAHTSADEAAASAVGASSSADSAHASQLEAARYADRASESATSSEASSLTAEQQAKAAMSAASASTGSASASQGEASRAAHEADDAASSASTAVIAKGQADAAKALARAWASSPQGVPVEDGEFSAKHWAYKAQDFATGALIYAGSWDALNGTLPKDQKKGAFFKISGQGTVNGVTYRVWATISSITERIGTSSITRRW